MERSTYITTWLYTSEAPRTARIPPGGPHSSYGLPVPCDFCGLEFDPISTRWLCPHCHMKANCCDGAPLAACKVEPDSAQVSV